MVFGLVVEWSFKALAKCREWSSGAACLRGLWSFPVGGLGWPNGNRTGFFS